MNKTLLLIICDFLLLNLIHFTSWDTLDNETENPATGGSTTATVGAGGMGDISQDLELVTRQYRDIEDKLRKTQSTNFAMMAQMSDNEEQAAKRLAAVADLAKEWKGAFDKSAATNEQNALVIQGLSQDKKVALAERERERKLNKEKQETIDNLQDDKNKLDVELANANKNITGLSTTVKNLNGTIGDLKTAIGGLEVKFDKASGDAEAARKMAAAERARAIAALKAQADAERAQTAAETKTLAETQRANFAIQNAAVERARADTSARVAAASKVEQARAEKEAQAAMAQAKTARVETHAARAPTEVARNAATTARAQTAKAEQNLAVAVRENTGLKATVSEERQDKEIAQEAAEVAQRMLETELGNKPINANMMATLYLKNRVDLSLYAKRSLLAARDNSLTVLFETEEIIRGKKTSYVYALAHASETPFKLDEKSLGLRSAQGSVSAGNGAPQALPQVRFLADDPRMVLFPIGPANSPKVKAVGVKPYKLAIKPFKFPKAFIMSKNGRKFGEMDFKIDPANPGYVKVDRIFFNFGGRFNPVKGDLVFSQTGDLIGIMTSNKYCRVIQNTTPAYGITFGPKLNARAIALGLSRMKSIVNTKPFALQ
jgi:hypothetical protein